MKISVIHPTRGRKQQAIKTMSKWLFMADKPQEIEYIFSTDIDDIDKWCSRVEIMPKPLLFNYSKSIEVLKNNNKSAIEAINFAATRAIGDVFIVVSDDTDCQLGWDTALTIMCYSRIDFCAKTDDGLQPTLITMPVMDRVFYERYGYVYHPEYKHLFADQELTAVAMMTGKYVKLPLLFEHLHYSTGKTPKDAINSKNDSTWQQGERLFNERLKSNFGIESPVMEYNQIVWR